MVHVFHLEDDIRLREILQVALRAAEPDIVLKQVSTSQEAIEYINKNCTEIDLYILDIRVPGDKDGVDVAYHVRNLQCMAPIILTSAYQSPQTSVLTALKAEWYPKPWHVFETTRTLAKVARKFNQLRQEEVSEEVSAPSPETTPAEAPSITPEVPTPAEPAGESSEPALTETIDEKPELAVAGSENTNPSAPVEASEEKLTKEPVSTLPTAPTTAEPAPDGAVAPVDSAEVKPENETVPAAAIAPQDSDPDAEAVSSTDAVSLEVVDKQEQPVTAPEDSEASKTESQPDETGTQESKPIETNSSD